jgi:hypothetical protein
LTIGDVSRVLSVPVPTVRSWELRYGIPAGTRAPGSTRRYSVADVYMLKLMRDEISRGVPARLAADTARTLLNSDGPAAEFIAALLAASDERDPASITGTLDRAASILGLGACVDEVIFPAMRQVGLRWQTARCDVGQERLTTDTVCTWLDLQAIAVDGGPGSPMIVLACAPREFHMLGLHALGVLLSHRQVRCLRIGCGTAAQQLTTAVRQHNPSAVVVVSHLPSGRRPAISYLRTVQPTGTQAPRVFYAGNAFATARSRRGVPGRYLGTHLQDAGDIICDALDLAERCSISDGAGNELADRPGCSQ